MATLFLSNLIYLKNKDNMSVDKKVIYSFRGPSSLYNENDYIHGPWLKFSAWGKFNEWEHKTWEINQNWIMIIIYSVINSVYSMLPDFMRSGLRSYMNKI